LDPEFRGSTDVVARPLVPGWDPSELATVVLFDRQGWLTAVTAVLLALITLYGLRPTASAPATAMSTSWEPLPSIYRSKQEFLASLPPWRRLLQRHNWRPTVDLKVQLYALEQRLLQMQKEDERMQKEDERLRKLDERFAELDARLNAIVSSSSISSNPQPPTHDRSET
jgi:hypothetical protein